MADGLLRDGDCDDPRDLAKLADVVVSKLGRQRDLVERMRPEALERATPNLGHMIAVALLAEGALGAIVTLNYDLSLSHAVSQLGCDLPISLIEGPRDLARIGERNVVYLHRSAREDPESWVLRTTALNDEWRDGWEQVIAGRALAVGAVLFCGLGSPAPVLAESVSAISAKFGALSRWFVARRPHSESTFAAGLGIDVDHYLQREWTALAEELSRSVSAEYAASVGAAARRLGVSNGWGNADDAVIRSCVAALSVVDLGLMRASIALSPSRYMTARQDLLPEHLADLLSAIASGLEPAGSRMVLTANGHLAFYDGSLEGRRIGLASGLGYVRLTSIETAIAKRTKLSVTGWQRPSIYVVGGVVGQAAPLPPLDIVADAEVHSIVDPQRHIRILTVDDVRGNLQPIVDDAA